MPLAEKSLEDEIKSKKMKNEWFSENESFNLALQILSALITLKNNCREGNDLKPDNILIYSKCIFKLADFGCSKIQKILLVFFF